MPKSHRPYSRDFRQRIIDLVRKGRTPEELARQLSEVDINALRALAPAPRPKAITPQPPTPPPAGPAGTAPRHRPDETLDLGLVVVAVESAARWFSGTGPSSGSTGCRARRSASRAS